MSKPYNPKDFYYRKAKKAGLRARSAFKIEEILHRHKLVARGDAVLDLGAAPGGFLQILAEAVGEKGVAVGVDLEPVRNLGKPWVRTAIVDLLAPDALEKIRALHPSSFRLVTSDMAPKTIGIKVTDEARSLELVDMALAVAEQTLAPGGAFVAKVFMGGDFPRLRKDLEKRFESFHVVRPEATRESSYEVYVMGKRFRGGHRRAGEGVNATPSPASTPPPAVPSSPRPAARPERSGGEAVAEPKGPPAVARGEEGPGSVAPRPTPKRKPGPAVQPEPEARRKPSASAQRKAASAVRRKAKTATTRKPSGSGALKATLPSRTGSRARKIR
jgi:23S rRNA (uridine2552-2'-O)-methyltransferase